MASCSSHSGRGQDRVRGDAVLAQGYRASQRLIAGALPTDRPTGQEPMRRYTHPIPCPAVRTFPADAQACLEQIAQLLTTQNQLLVDILGAVNSLTAASLSAQRRP